MPEPTLPSPMLEALAHAAPVTSGPERVAEAELFRLRIGDTSFAVEAGLVQEVVRTPPVTPLPGAPAFLIGVAAHRGDVVAMVDLARLLVRGETQISSRSRMAIARADGLVVALLADEVLGLVRVASASIQPPPLGTEDAEFISGIVVGKDPVHILDLRRALATARERAAVRR